MRIVLVLALGACLVASARPARAQETILPSNGDGMSLRLFRAAVDSKGLVTVNAASVLGHLEPSFGLVLDAGLGVLPVAGPSGRQLVDGLYTGAFSANLGLFNAAVVGIELPVQIGQGSFDGSIEGLSTAAGGNRTLLDLQALGDVALHAKLRLLRTERNPFGLALVLRAGLPTGSARSFAGDPGGSLWPSLALEVAPSRRFRAAVNAGIRVVLGEGSTVGSGDARVTAGSELTFGAGVSYQLVAGTLDLVAETYGTTLVAEPLTPRATPVEAIGGLKIFVERSSFLYLGAGLGLTNGYAAADQRLFLAFVFEPSIGDRDGDGLLDDVDRCRDEPEDHDQFEDEDGCPDRDDDRDSILDPDDECRFIPEDRDGNEDLDGCPDSSATDRDGDHILDPVDGCPDEPEDADGFEDADGCPDPDNDRDAIVDVDDLCPNDPEDRDHFEDTDGCPDPDNDHDRILDPDDECPDDPEKYNGTEDEDGCPDTGIITIRGPELVVLREIGFETDSAVIQRQSFPLLDTIASALQGNPQIRLIEIQGHADERAPDEYNLQLTRDRAAAVREGLVQRGVARARVRSAGYGERCPVDPRHGPRAWRRNRRVAFKILETDRGPTGVELTCPAGRALTPP